MNANRIRLFATDVDDTLLSDDLSISDRNRQAVRRAQAAGVVIVLASGRPTAGMAAVAAELGLHPRRDWLVSFNGGAVGNPDGTVLWQTGFDRREGLELWDAAEREGLGWLSYDQSGIVTVRPDPWNAEEARLTGLPVRTIGRDGLPAFLPKVILLGAPERLAEAAPRLRERYGRRWQIATSKPFFLEITPLGVEKGSCLQRLADHLGIAAEQCLAIGDGHNDLPMLRWAGVGVAVANAAAAVREAADWVSAANREHGVALALERFALD